MQVLSEMTKKVGAAAVYCQSAVTAAELALQRAVGKAVEAHGANLKAVWGSQTLLCLDKLPFQVSNMPTSFGKAFGRPLRVFGCCCCCCCCCSYYCMSRASGLRASDPDQGQGRPAVMRAIWHSLPVLCPDKTPFGMSTVQQNWRDSEKDPCLLMTCVEELARRHPGVATRVLCVESCPSKYPTCQYSLEKLSILFMLLEDPSVCFSLQKSCLLLLHGQEPI